MKFLSRIFALAVLAFVGLYILQIGLSMIWTLLSFAVLLAVIAVVFRLLRSQPRGGNT